jgi:arylsulfatase A-like enzyme
MIPAMVGFGLGLFTAVPAQAQERPNVLVLTVDALRTDRMSVYGYERGTTPYLDRFASEAIVFDRAFSTGAWTSPGIVSLFTGNHPPSHGQGSQQDVIDGGLVTPLDVFAQNGYRVIGRDTSGPTYEGLGFRLGYGEQITQYEPAAAWVASQPGPWIAWVHVKPTHLPYKPSPFAARLFGGDRLDTPAVRAVKTSGTVFPKDYGLSWKPPVIPSFTPEEQAVVRDLYDGAVYDADSLVGRILEDFRARGLLDKTIVVLTADHGEELFEHGWVGHASTGYEGKVYDELIRIPLMIRLPSGPKGVRVSTLTSQIDVMPTLFGVLELDLTKVDGGMQGRSLVPWFGGSAPPGSEERPIFARTTFKGWTCPPAETRDGATAIRTPDRKVIRVRRAGVVTHEAYDLKSDPGELRDLYPSEPARFADLVAGLDAWDRENQTHAARLMAVAAERHLDTLRKAAAARAALPAAEAWRGLMALKQTYLNEWLSPFDDPAFRARWSGWEREAARLRDQASR